MNSKKEKEIKRKNKKKNREIILTKLCIKNKTSKINQEKMKQIIKMLNQSIYHKDDRIDLHIIIEVLTK